MCRGRIDRSHSNWSGALAPITTVAALLVSLHVTANAEVFTTSIVLALVGFLSGVTVGVDL